MNFLSQWNMIFTQHLLNRHTVADPAYGIPKINTRTSERQYQCHDIQEWTQKKKIICQLEIRRVSRCHEGKDQHEHEEIRHMLGQRIQIQYLNPCNPNTIQATDACPPFSIEGGELGVGKFQRLRISYKCIFFQLKCVRVVTWFRYEIP